MTLEVSAEDERRIESVIGSDASPVGIDAKRTHVIIIDKLERIEQRLALLESKLARLNDD